MSETPPPPKLTPWQRLLMFLATGLGLGWLPKAPGTWGSLLGPVLVYGLGTAGDPVLSTVAGIVCFLIGVPICNVGIDVLRSKDPKQVVYDEIAAFCWVYLVVPLNPWTAVAGFALFRAFDILKPWPIRRFELLPRGWGVMADDLIAGLMASAVLSALYWLVG
ncbi:MAG: phosphatidylglycerophosphatase A [Planctomycetaceae bacterium]|nr:phosphatidylglycerophosphatase A [Planctomycetaceae bacterium]